MPLLGVLVHAAWTRSARSDRTGPFALLLMWNYTSTPWFAGECTSSCFSLHHPVAMLSMRAPSGRPRGYSYPRTLIVLVKTHTGGARAESARLGACSIPFRMLLILRGVIYGIEDRIQSALCGGWRGGAPFASFFFRILFSVDLSKKS